MPLSPEDLQHIAAGTLAHHEQHAQSYWEGTRDHDVGQNIAALMKHIPGPPPFDLLDFGCGPADRAAAQAGERVTQALSPGARALRVS